MNKIYKIENGIIHGVTFATRLDAIEFITWRFNNEVAEFWVKFHLPSGKEIRIKTSEDELREIVDEWSGIKLELELGELDDLEY